MAIKFDWDSSRGQGVISGEYFTAIREHFSVTNEAARFARYRGGYAPSRKYIITPAGRFDIGLYDEIQKFIIERNLDTQVVTTDTFVQHALPKYNVSDIPKLSLELRDYQQNIVNNCLTSGRGVIILATAGGKTLTIASLIESLYRDNNTLRCAVIVPDRGLVNQTYSDFDSYDVSFKSSKWTGSDDLDLSANVIICNLGILQSNKSNTDWLNYIDVCIVDEVHKLRRGNKYL